jgi:aminoglycoside 3-N-acetyltransferase
MASRTGLAGTRAVVTAQELEGTLRRLGVREGGVLLVHASLGPLGYVVHGVDAVRLVLRDLLGPEGTLLVPSFTGERTDPASWIDPPLPASLWDQVRASTPLYDPRRTLPRSMGQLALAMLMDPDCERSSHPLVSFAAIGPRADELVDDHSLVDPFGPQSPLARAHDLDAQVLLLGVDQTRNSVVYHAQCLADLPQVRGCRAPFLASVDGERRWVEPTRLPVCSEGFGRVEDELVARGLVRCGRVGDGTARLMSVAPLVEFLRGHLRVWPRAIDCDRPECGQCAAP